MQIPKCYIAQCKTGEIVAISQLNSVDDEWLCHHCRCPLNFHPPASGAGAGAGELSISTPRRVGNINLLTN